ncbi:MAG: sn-glycerol-3-phosphate ABC transporter ATP-binding protein UgpC [Hyphomicrobiales bacterium]|nr:sn-glycerol-3-phosphate ABC transporter ATP-binding protein UgpC [Hyphomicrobiales bacterium]
MAQVELIGVDKRFGEVEVIHDIDLVINHGELVVFVGPSGCGKSTLLRLICGLENLSAGAVRIDGKPMRGVDPAKREVAMVFQSYALYPHMNVADNMGFALRMAGISKAQRRERVSEAARILQLDELLDRLPKELSGGQRQRVAIGRAIVRNPQVFLFDEPLSNLDAELRVQMRLEILNLHRQLGATMIYVTHDQVEAMTMADRIVVLRGGKIEQVGTPIELYSAPDNLFVAGFIGSPKMNQLSATTRSVKDGIAEIAIDGDDGGVLTIPVGAESITPGDPVTLGVRPEHFIAAEDAAATIRAQVEFVEHLGGTSLLHAPGHPAGSLVVETRDGPPPAPGPQRFGIDPARAHLFVKSGRAVPRPGHPTAAA